MSLTAKQLILDGTKAGVLSDMDSITDYIQANDDDNACLHMSTLEVQCLVHRMIRDGDLFWSGSGLTLSSSRRANRVPFGYKKRMDRNPVKGTRDTQVYNCSRCSRRHAAENMAVWFDKDVSDLSCGCRVGTACTSCAEERVHFNPRVGTVSVELATFDLDDLCEYGSPTQPLCMFCAIDFDTKDTSYKCYACHASVGKDRLGVVVTPLEGGDDRRWEHPTLSGKTGYVDICSGIDCTLCLDCCVARLFGHNIKSE